MSYRNGPASLERQNPQTGMSHFVLAARLWSGGVGVVSATLLFASLGCRITEGQSEAAAVREAEEALLVATRDKDWGRMLEFLPARVREHTTPDDLGVAVEASGQLLLSWELGEVQPMKVDSNGRDIDGFGVQVKGAWRNLPGHTGQTSDQWTDFWFRADGRWVWTGRD